MLSDGASAGCYITVHVVVRWYKCRVLYNSALLSDGASAGWCTTVHVVRWCKCRVLYNGACCQMVQVQGVT